MRPMDAILLSRAPSVNAPMARRDPIGAMFEGLVVELRDVMR